MGLWYDEHYKDQIRFGLKIKQTLMSLLSLRLPGWDPERTLRAMLPFVGWMFHPFCVTVCMIFVVSSWLVLGANLEVFRSKLPEFQSFFGWPNLIVQPHSAWYSPAASLAPYTRQIDDLARFLRGEQPDGVIPGGS